MPPILRPKTYQDITNSAQTSRVNFYNYFSDKEDLMWKTFQYHFLSMEERVAKIDPITLLSDGKPLTYYWFEIVRKNRIFFYSLFVNGMPYSLEIKILDYLQKESYRTHEVFRIRYKNEKIPYIRINQYLTGALIHLTRELLRENEEYYGWELTWERGNKDSFPTASEFIVATKTFQYATSEPEDIWENAEKNPLDWEMEELEPDGEELLDLIPDEEEYPEQDPRISAVRKELNKNYSTALQVFKLFKRRGRIDEDITIYELVYFWWTKKEYSIFRFREKVLH